MGHSFIVTYVERTDRFVSLTHANKLKNYEEM